MGGDGELLRNMKLMVICAKCFELKRASRQASGAHSNVSHCMSFVVDFHIVSNVILGVTLQHAIAILNLRVLVNVWVLLFVIFLVNHVVSCGWATIGELDDFSDTGSTWRMSAEDAEDEDNSIWSRRFTYFTALHWALTQMTPGQECNDMLIWRQALTYKFDRQQRSAVHKDKVFSAPSKLCALA
eukprot:571612-Amphidinium_carterae.2